MEKHVAATNAGETDNLIITRITVLVLPFVHILIRGYLCCIDIGQYNTAEKIVDVQRLCLHDGGDGRFFGIARCGDNARHHAKPPIDFIEFLERIDDVILMDERRINKGETSFDILCSVQRAALNDTDDKFPIVIESGCIVGIKRPALDNKRIFQHGFLNNGFLIRCYLVGLRRFRAFVFLWVKNVDKHNGIHRIKLELRIHRFRERVLVPIMMIPNSLNRFIPTVADYRLVHIL